MSDDLRVGVSVGGSGSFRDHVVLAQQAERRGFDLITTGDNGAETFALLGALAVATERVELIASIAGWTRTPATMAHAAATVSALSDGRFTLGLGPTPKAWVEGWHGMEFDPVLPRMKEYVTAVRACLAATPDAPTDVTGQWFSTHGYTNWGMQAPPTPVALGVTLPRMTELAGEVCDGVMLNSIVPFEAVNTATRDRLDTGRSRGPLADRPLRVGIGRFAGVDDDRDRAYDLCRAQIAFYFQIPYFATVLEPYGFEAEVAAGTAAAAAGDQQAMVAAVSDRLVDALGVAGTPAEARERLQAYAGQVDWVVLAGTMNLPAEMGRAHTARILEVFGRS
ncbi:LLM class flavin-dependent oxidoreductase [Nakamurella leprariae]|uniref:LLM class flavin-dependent oxidoreductase n=1 Tax=Nakamurella leprariae TaxID=2803911 RepID=A0A939BXR1_9ACTN|nr:LLM class flavin-dependent oxidoreductase [Nakamurella leprariae]MBM9468818.1 LLM class flavin-dependent oxidoreductase [Nakamurella leprariae]